MTEQEKIKLIFAFKIKYLRQQKKLSYHQLKDLTGLSTSYLHDIEKGNKYPKIDKINALAQALGTSYDELVSTKASKKIQPIIDLLHSDFVKLFPMEMFGLDWYRLFEMFSNTPDRVTAFISTIIKITRNYQLRNEHFYQAALRSYQDMYDNYFEDLELAVKDFKAEHKLKRKAPYKTSVLENILLKKYGIKVDRAVLPQKKVLRSVRSYFAQSKKTLFINSALNSAQVNFLLGRELAFQYFQFEERPYTTRIVRPESFEKLFNNFKASYFAVALLMDEEELVKDIRAFAKLPTWSEKPLLLLLDKYDVTPEMLLQRMTNLFPKHLGISDLFFLRMAGRSDLKSYRMSKELHLSQLHEPHANMNNEHYCRRWVSINIIKHIRVNKSKATFADAQISSYWQTNNDYLCLSFAKRDTKQNNENVSVTIGLLINDKVRNLFGFLNDPKLKRKTVNNTCERCSMPHCEERVVPPLVIEKQEEKQKVLDALKEING